MADKRKYSKKYCRYCEAKVEFLDYKDPAAFKFSLSERYRKSNFLYPNFFHKVSYI